MGLCEGRGLGAGEEDQLRNPNSKSRGSLFKRKDSSLRKEEGPGFESSLAKRAKIQGRRDDLPNLTSSGGVAINRQGTWLSGAEEKLHQ